MTLDTTKPTDTELLSTYAAYIRTIASRVEELSALVGGDFSRSINAQNTSTALTTSDLSKIYTVNSASAVVITLPEVTVAEKGAWVRVHKIGVGNLTITPGGSDVIATGAAGGAIADTEAAEPKAAFIELEVTAAGQWMICGLLGTWNFV